MAPSASTSKVARSIALRMKAVQMKRCRKTVSEPPITSPNRKPTTPKKAAARLIEANKATSPRRSPRKHKATQSSKDVSSRRRMAPPKAVNSKVAVAAKKSSSGRKSAKSKSSEDSDDDDNITGGLRLLKRGMVSMNKITRRLIRGKKLKVNSNADGEPIGKAAKEMQSYIGVLARTKIPISINDWRNVPLDEKDKIWNSIQDAYVVPKEWKKLVITSAGHKWREFKSKLTNWYIIPYLDSPELLKFPPDDYRSIEVDEWNTFVADRTSEQFQVLREKQKIKRKENKYPHRLSRKGYANFQEELAEKIPIEELDRATMWIKARQDKSGNFKGPAVKKKVEKIESLKRKVSEGEINPEGTDDVLTLALGNPEYPGRVRGVGGFVKPSAYFHLPKRPMLNVEDSVRVSVKKILAEEKENIIAQERAKWELEMERQIARERAAWEERFQKLEAMVKGKEMPADSPKPVTPLNDLGSGQGSCSRLLEQAGLKAIEIQAAKTAKKKLVLGEDQQKVVEENEVFVDGELNIKLTSIIEEEVRNDLTPKKNAVVEQVQVPVQSTNIVQSGCKLAIDSLDNIVAEGTIIEVDVESSKQTIHGVPLVEENVRVSITKSIVANALLPIPIKDEILFVRDAIGTCIAWPRDWVIPTAADAKQQKHKIVRRKKKDTYDDFFDHDDLDKLPPNLPPPLKTLATWANDNLKDGITIHTTLGEELFGYRKKVAIFRRDVYAMTNMEEVSAGCVVMYMSFLYQVLKKSKMLDMIGFVDPANTGVIGCGNPTERARSLSVSYERGKPGQIFLVPYNSGCHWMLTVANPTEEVVYFMDPLKRRLITGEWRTIVDNSIKIFNAQKHRKGRKTVQWKNCAGIPEQMGDKTCGYWIMHYMRDIVEDKNQEWSAKWERKANHYYTMENVDVVRAEWAKYVMKFRDN
ncbi:uncharacterized protein LOC133712759 [Rosa rugosa]|uniref:uncharacterized protein LOC133707123 n=5 Tax=Rosa rugosa TaxID=74645 RepID=UPI002B40BF97|nr:uncharacterized protein LOC133707123 [Rosa rugosa]XP_061994857.1 uncharacterized protein LOC133712759 [Rosa rugosa]